MITIDQNCQLFCGDCLEVMKQIPDESVDCVLTDPPYKINYTTGGTKNIGMQNRWQGNIKAGNTIMGFDTNICFSQWLPFCYNLLKCGGHIYVFCNDKNILKLMQEMFNVGFVVSNILVWKKNNATPNKYYMKNAEFIVFAYKKPAVAINHKGTKTVLEFDNINGKQKKHPTEKPTKLLEILVSNSTSDDGTVLDPFMGSGTTGVACRNLNRKFIGIELDEEYFKTAENRIKRGEK